MLKSVLRVLSNLTFVTITFSSVVNVVSVAGTISFMPKYFAAQYSVPLWKANIIMGKFVFHLSLVVRKPVFGVSDQVRHKPGCTATEEG